MNKDYIIHYYNPKTGEQFSDLTKYSFRSHALANLKQGLYSQIEEVDNEKDMHDNLNKIFEFFCLGTDCKNCFKWNECHGVKQRSFEDYSLGEKIELCARMTKWYGKRN